VPRFCLHRFSACRQRIDQGAPPGFPEGHLKIVSLNEVDPADEMARQSATTKI
jgi:hypothetical protein